MKAGNSKLEVGTKVVLQNIKDVDFEFLNGLTGKVTHPFAFGCTAKGWVGIRLENDEQYNVKETECKLINEIETK